MNLKLLAIKQLDKQVRAWKLVAEKYPRPSVGWVKAVRTALSMTTEQLAKRLYLSRSRMSQLEDAEVNDATTLRALREVADAMECELVYAIVPKGTKSLESIIETKANELADERVERVGHSMSLEAQSVEPETLKSQKKELAKNLFEHPNKKLWSFKEIKPTGKSLEFTKKPKIKKRK